MKDFVEEAKVRHGEKTGGAGVVFKSRKGELTATTIRRNRSGKTIKTVVVL